MTPIAQSLLHRFRAAFADLAELSRVSPADQAKIAEHIAGHMRSAHPMAAPVTDPVAEVSRELKDGSRYRISVAGGSVVLTLSHPDAAFTAVEIVRLRVDLADVAASVQP